MSRPLIKGGLAATMLAAGLALAGGAQAAPFPVGPQALGLEGGATPVAMCGRSCRGGGQYIPGPPSVCAMNGLNYCGSSRGYGPPPRVYVEPRPRYVEPRRHVYEERRRGPVYQERRRVRPSDQTPGVYIPGFSSPAYR